MSFTQTLQSRATGANQAEATDTTTAAGAGDDTARTAAEARIAAYNALSRRQSGETPPKLDLYVDCEPVGLDVTYLLNDINERSKKIVAEWNEKKGTSLVNLHEIAYSEGVKALVASYQRQPIYGRVVAPSRGLLAPAVLDVLQPQAALVVRSLA